jgi:hypothetical protein
MKNYHWFALMFAALQACSPTYGERQIGAKFVCVFVSPSVIKALGDLIEERRRLDNGSTRGPITSSLRDLSAMWNFSYSETGLITYLGDRSEMVSNIKWGKSGLASKIDNPLTINELESLINDSRLTNYTAEVRVVGSVSAFPSPYYVLEVGVYESYQSFKDGLFPKYIIEDRISSGQLSDLIKYGYYNPRMVFGRNKDTTTESTPR